ncbi:MAG: hypothetical protein AAFX08_05310 [Pseudomonadota bacterium]
MADGALISNGNRPKVAFAGEEFGFGYQAVHKFAGDNARSARRRLYDAGAAAVSDGKISVQWRRLGRRDDETLKGDGGFDLASPEMRPLHTKEQALVAVRNKTVDMAVVPFYAPYTGYDIETLNTLSSLLTLVAVQQINATDQFCLAVYEPQLLDVIQTSHPGSGLSGLLNSKRNRWQSNAWKDTQAFLNAGEGDETSRQYGAGFQLDASAQYMLRERIDTVFAGPEAVRRCKSKLDGLRSAGVEVRETLNTVEPHREMSRLARNTLNNTRQTSTSFDPRGGGTMFTSTMSAENPNAKLYGVVMPFEIAYQSPDFVIIDDNIQDADKEDPSVQTRFMLVRDIVDETILDDKLGLTGNRAQYWLTRLTDVLRDAENADGEGVRVMFRFRRSKKAASVGDVENFLRHHGVRYNVVKINEDSGKDDPGSLVLDVEFERRHFNRGIPLISRSPVREVLGAAFARWKGRSVSVIAAMPIDAHQLPESGRRRFYVDNIVSGFRTFVRDKWIRHRIWGTALAAGAIAWFGRDVIPAQAASIFAALQRLFGG